MPETHERGPKPLTGRGLRPRPLGHIWAWIVLAVGVVILMVIALWVVTAGKTRSEGLADKEVIHDVSSRWRVRWAQVPGPPAEYVASAEAALGERRLDDASRWLSKAIALEPGNPRAWVTMTCLSIAHSSAYQMTDGEIDGVLEVLAAVPGMDVSGLANWRVLRSGLADESHEAGTWVATCAGMGGAPEQIESTAKTLDTIEATP